jgi:hypothetical protein
MNSHSLTSRRRLCKFHIHSMNFIATKTQPKLSLQTEILWYISQCECNWTANLSVNFLSGQNRKKNVKEE